LEITSTGITQTPPKLIGKIRKAYITIMRNLSDEQFDSYLQSQLALENHRDLTAGLWATDSPQEFEGEPGFHLLNKIEYTGDARGWVFKGPYLKDIDD
jgi:hypothetical protein